MGELLGFCVVANVARETESGEGGLEIRSGLRHFSGGTKLWVLPPQWGDGGEAVVVAGRHRGRRGGHVRMVVQRRHLENFRVKGIYHPGLMRVLTAPDERGGVRFWEDRDEAEKAVAWWSRRTLPAQNHELDFPRDLGDVSDPPPLELRKGGRLYYLAHFNAHRAVYSLLPPPVEEVGPPSGR
ncbi:hypothetical protein [Actinomadura verrucosospora]|uniref:Uncharacterized protein n=1 Tax=Actinomadura verrucosospora TaxID=46165 RepID=A0A7D3VQK1_ACTVE|nr:hypothetical protein [Actinomadura verrucosospora]QKG20438.1 hypothetical protein ACTIVE_2076 [Actinomadura verrucosospora]